MALNVFGDKSYDEVMSTTKCLKNPPITKKLELPVSPSSTSTSSPLPHEISPAKSTGGMQITTSLMSRS